MRTMSLNIPHKKLIVVSGVLAAVTFSLCTAVSQERPVAAGLCSAPEYRQFDFWVGDWDSYDPTTSTKDAHVRVDRILGGCVIHEDYQSVDGHKGESFSIYDASRRVWHQTWVTNGGTLLVIEGSFESGEMVLSGIDHQVGDSIVRGVWKPVDDGVRETAVRSADGGKTWKPWFDLMFRAHK